MIAAMVFLAVLATMSDTRGAGRPLTAEQIYERCAPAVVTILTKTAGELTGSTGDMGNRIDRGHG